MDLMDRECVDFMAIADNKSNRITCNVCLPSTPAILSAPTSEKNKNSGLATILGAVDKTRNSFITKFVGYFFAYVCPCVSGTSIYFQMD